MKIVIALFVLLLSSCQSIEAIEFTIADPIVSGLEISVSSSLSGTTSNYFLQGTLRAVDSSKYFGETYGRTSWIDYLSSPDKEFITSNFYMTDVQNASWSGTLKMRYKVDDQVYKGPGSYELKLRRFTGNSSNAAGESNVMTITLTEPLPLPSPTPVPSPTPTPSASQPSQSPITILSPSPQVSPVVLAPPSVETEVYSSKEGTIAGEQDIDLSAFGVASATPAASSSQTSSTGLSLNKERARIAIMIGIGLTTVSVAVYMAFRRFTSTRQE